MIRKAIIISISGYILTKEEKKIIKKEKPWGLILFKRNILSENQTIKLIKSIRKIMKDNKYPILIDEEGGRVSRISNFKNNSQFNQKYFGDIYNRNKDLGLILYRAYIDSLSEILNKLGININTVPVLDLITKKGHKIIGNRSFSSDSDIVNKLGKFSVNCYKKKKNCNSS